MTQSNGVAGRLQTPLQHQLSKVRYLRMHSNVGLDQIAP
ncbi:hypothetical protein ymoll0001_40850 [Yersinia mollaretii ATCC 43969]|uniref:Uncharacterized protein n=1 Tax=Yersinia mollaretii (strain ATCC 43969 / DSM 18520 / CIP 103324 / CNY 7263 / WAIP 204) TaxID=349967 RepID=A0ABM9Y4U2_YERMW|nr:hypothetical protein ymoll0001_40850 [Yersinia mollaretii ATCC 43969]